MLTATYTLVALSVEQAKVRVGLQSLQQLIESNFVHQSELTAGQVCYACDAVKRMYESCHWRKLDMFLIPAIRSATCQADELLQNLEELGHAAADAVGQIAIRLGSTAVDSVAKVAQFCAAVDAFCSATLKRLELEEKRLFPVARSVISGEAWFSIANQMLAHDAYVLETRPLRPVPMFREQLAEPTRAPAQQEPAAANLVH
jgi:hemerythrin-like domain-containing protein